MFRGSVHISEKIIALWKTRGIFFLHSSLTKSMGHHVLLTFICLGLYITLINQSATLYMIRVSVIPMEGLGFQSDVRISNLTTSSKSHDKEKIVASRKNR